jgi:hypothetical protein
LLIKRLGEVKQTVKAVFLHSFKEVGTGPVAFVLGQQPAVHDVAGKGAVLEDPGYQGVIARSAFLTAQDVSVRVNLGEHIAALHGGHLMPGALQLAGKLFSGACIVEKNQPGPRFLVSARDKIWNRPFPGWTVPPVPHVLLAQERNIGPA